MSVVGEAAVVLRVPLHPASAALIERLGAQRGPVDVAVLRASRTAESDPVLAGGAEPVASRAEVVLPLRGAPRRARVYRGDLQRLAPVLLWLHGGGFCAGSVGDVEVVCAALARRAGLVVVSLDYRLAPEHPFPAALEDTLETLDWLYEHGSTLGGNGVVAVGGQSAGANLAAAASLSARSRLQEGVPEHAPQPAAQILCYPALDFECTSESWTTYDGVLLDRTRTAWYHEQYLAGQESSELSSPLLAGSLASLPPSLVITAECDPYRDDGRRYAQRLAADGVPVHHSEYEGAIHAFLNFPAALPYANDAIDEIVHYLRTKLSYTGGGRLQHVTVLYDSDRATELDAIYRKALGLRCKTPPQAFTAMGIRWYRAGTDSREIHFVPADKAEAANPHLCIAVDKDLREVAACVEAAGLKVELNDAIPDRPRFFFTDPFDNLVEVVAMTACA